ncbi:helix-turn-helix transcriptional regulator [Mucilaginibacter sp. ZT4R22]|uniref:Helix-turn-helix transcriptional regulator n=1 Tax=Mucilaginibacter pankratovii TaxID=2772110 RepID=A0ABR7WT12_9SPHI|nr:AraC family transcriptional regulator [Mucilaginibacter pankratovii]MBD1365410.1 helix-turn-helix transcriptional regulator [Mucilaginibacter pankratovii]
MSMTFTNNDIDSGLGLIQKYRDAFDKYQNDGIIEMDKRVKYRFDFQIYRMEDILPIVSRVIPPMRQSTYSIALIKKGAGEQSIGQFTFPITDNSLFVVPRYVIHSSKYTSTDCSGYLLMFDIDFFLNSSFIKDRIGRNRVLKNPPQPYLHIDEQKARALAKIFECIIEEFTSGDEANREMIAIKILELLINFDRFLIKAELSVKTVNFHPVIEKFNELLERNFDKYKSVQYYADALSIHPNHLNFLLKKYNGTNAKQSINNKIIVESKYLLSDQKLIIKEIAYKLGFEDPNNFSTFFQKHAGICPVAFRNSLNKRMTGTFG